MKSVNEIKEIKHNWHEGRCSFAIESLCDALIGITEHLEAQSHNRVEMIDPDVRGEMRQIQLGKAIRREGRIEALRKIREMTVGGAAYVSLINWIDEAITRLENGGEL